MSVEAMAIVLHHSQARGNTKLVLVGIANHHSDRGAWPSLKTLQKYAGGITERNVRKAIRELEDLGELATYVQGGGDSGTRGGRETNRYFLLLECPSWCDRSMNHRDVREIDVPMPWPGQTSDRPKPGKQDGRRADPGR